MTKEQYEKLKEWVRAMAVQAMLQSKHTRAEALLIEKEFDKSMGFEE
jgi:hypothetical protein